MWYLLFVFLVPVNGYSSLCSAPVAVTCKPPSPTPDLIPANGRELHDLCSVITDYVECLHSFDLACGGRTEYKGLAPPLYYSRIKSFLDDVCEEEGSLRKALARNLPCIKVRTNQGELSCAKPREKVLEAYHTYLVAYPEAKQKLKGSHEKRDRQRCLSTVATASCVLQNIRKDCGFLSYELAYGALTRTQILGDSCGLDIFQELADEIDDFQLESNLKEEIKKYFVIELE